MKMFKIAALVLVACLPQVATAQSKAEVKLAQQVLGEIQGQSIRENVEYCGYIGFDKAGQLIASRPVRGDEASCLAKTPRAIRVITASYHTHGAFSEDYFGETPSGDDMEGDEEMGIDGYVATPGGRMWYVDTDEMITRQLCGIGCLPRDGHFRPGVDGRIQESYTYGQLVKRLDQ